MFGGFTGQSMSKESIASMQMIGHNEFVQSLQQTVGVVDSHQLAGPTPVCAAKISVRKPT